MSSTSSSTCSPDGRYVAEKASADHLDGPEELKEELLTDHHRNESDKRSPEENMAVIRLYGGVQFPGGPLEATPRRWLKKLGTVKKRRKLNNNREQDTSVEDNGGGSSEGQFD